MISRLLLLRLNREFWGLNKIFCKQIKQLLEYYGVCMRFVW